jgi:hypothetical protein
LVYSSFELAAERIGDIVPPVYERYFKRDPDAAALMAHMDELTLGRMLTEVVRLLMSTDFADDAGYLDFEVKTTSGHTGARTHVRRAVALGSGDGRRLRSARNGTTLTRRRGTGASPIS